MNKNVTKIDKPGGKVKYTQQESFTAAKNLLNKVVIVGVAITDLAILGIFGIAGFQDYLYNKQLKAKAKNGQCK